MSIKDNFLEIRNEIPDNVKIVLAAKKRSVQEIKEVIDAGATDLGENYIQEFEAMYNALDDDYKKRVRWHMIGSLQKNKINKLLPIVDVVQTIDSYEKADAINKRAERINKKIEVLIEINIGSEITKSGLAPEYEAVQEVVKKIAELEFIKVKGLMTMGPRFGDPEDSRLYFRKTKEIFDKLKALNIANTDFEFLSMGMSNSYKVAIEEGSNIIRPGTIIFGQR